MKDNNEVISEFNEYVNMTASELEKWLKSDDSNSAGWTKDGNGDGESVGHDSGRKIVEILKANPDKTPDKYTDDQLQHMRKVASYCKRHLAQESAGNKEKDPEEVKETKSYISLKNWGHDFLKAQGKEESGGSANGGGKKNGSKKKKKKEEEEEEEDDDKEEDEEENGGEKKENGNGKKAGDEEEEEKEEEEEDKDKKAGDKRKKSGQQNGSNKKQETRKTRSSDKNGDDDQNEEDAKDEQQEEEEEEEEDNDAEADEQEGENGNSGGNGKSGKKGPKKGDTVSWNWGSGNPKGKVLDVKEDKASITTKRGNEVTRDGDSEDPAVILDTGKSKAIKSAHELN